MSNWGKGRSSDIQAAGANTVAGLLKGNQPFAQADTLASKRNVIATVNGWVRRQNKTDMHGNVRQIDEMLVPIAGLANSTNLGFPDVSQVYVSTNNSSNTANVYVVFNEPVKVNATCTLVVANTASGNAINGTVSSAAADVINANNTLVFRMSGIVPGTYKVEAQTIANTATGAVVSLNAGGETANLVITGASSNALSTFTLNGG